MRKDNIIRFDPKTILMEKIEGYLESEQKFRNERSQAVQFLLKAFKEVDNATKQKIVLLLGGSAKEDIVWPLYRIMADAEEDDEIRYIASIQLKLILPAIKGPQALIGRLIDDLESEDTDLVIYAAAALGWEGNHAAAIPLIALLFGNHMDVAHAAVNALTDIGDDRIFTLLENRLEHGPIELKRCILFNLWHLKSKKTQVVSAYLKFLEHEDSDLRYDSLLLLRSVMSPSDCLDCYQKCLSDQEPRIKLLALERLAEINGRDLIRLKKKIKTLISDPNRDVQAAAKKIYDRLTV
jgi:HEAT repeat protein